MRWLLPLLLLGCHHDRTLDKQAAAKLFDIVELEGVPAGMSDLTIDDAGALWSIPERAHKVVRIVDNKPTTFALEGIAAGVDTEAIASLGGDRFAIGIEGAHDPTTGIAFATLAGDKLDVDQPRTFNAAELGVEPTTNHGIESICGRDDELLAASEMVRKLPDGSRWAALVRIRGAETKFGKVRLTSDRGKLSAMSCKFADDGSVEVTALERHFGVARIVEFHVGADVNATATVTLDMHPTLRDALNLEGIARLPNGKLVLINDNQGKSVRGPTQLLYLR